MRKRGDGCIGLDLGSNTLRAVRYDPVNDRYLGTFERIVRTADGLAESQRVSDRSLRRVIDAIEEMKEEMAWDEAVGRRAVATEALRRARNRDQVLARIRDETGVVFEVIDGEEEARLSLLAVRRRLKLLGRPTDSLVLVDIGGGSTELVFADSGSFVARSVPLGIVTLAQSYGDIRSLERALPELLRPLREFSDRACRTLGGPPGSFVATAGTPTTVAALNLGMNYATYDAARINGATVHREDLARTLNKLLKMNERQRSTAVGVGREELIFAGITLFDSIFELLGFSECTVIDDGLREGVALSLCDGIGAGAS